MHELDCPDTYSEGGKGDLLRNLFLSELLEVIKGIGFGRQDSGSGDLVEQVC